MTLVITIFCHNTGSTMDLKTSVITRFQCANVLISMRMEDGVYTKAASSMDLFPLAAFDMGS